MRGYRALACVAVCRVCAEIISRGPWGVVQAGTQTLEAVWPQVPGSPPAPQGPCSAPECAQATRAVGRTARLSTLRAGRASRMRQGAHRALAVREGRPGSREHKGGPVERMRLLGTGEHGELHLPQGLGPPLAGL